jgi:tRNA(Ile)-lysidine synthase
MSDRMRTIASKANWADCGSRALVACSGGADSLALVALAVAAGIEVVVGHVDHGLRDDSDTEGVAIQRAVARLEVPVVSVRVSLEPGGNLEARARRARYRALEALAEDHGCDTVLTGHTLDDQAETVILATLRGSATDGIAGIARHRGRIRRPLLDVRRAETHEVCRLLGWEPLDDPMNRDVAFTRVWIRREIMPRLTLGMGRDLAVVLARQADVAREDRAVLSEIASTLVADGRPAAKDVAAAPIALARRAIRQWIGRPVDLATVDRVLAVARGCATAADIGAGQSVRRSAGVLFLELETAPAPPEPERFAVPGRVRWGDLELVARIDHAPPLGWPDGRSVVVLDGDVVGDEVVVRATSAADRLIGIGRTSSRSVIAARKSVGVAVDERHAWPVVASPDGEILWALGYRGAHAARVTARTRRYCWMTVTEASC